MSETDPTTRPLWAAFLVLFAVIVVAAFGPVDPMVWAFPAWAVVVIGAVVGAVVAGAVAGVAFGWPRVETGETDAGGEPEP
jgi:uncharacterized membrane protein YccC